MSRHFRRYCIALGREMNMTVRELLQRMSSSEIAEQMAYDLTTDEEWRQKYNNEQAQKRADEMTDEEVDAMIMSLNISKVKNG